MSLPVRLQQSVFIICLSLIAGACSPSNDSKPGVPAEQWPTATGYRYLRGYGQCVDRTGKPATRAGVVGECGVLDQDLSGLTFPKNMKGAVLTGTLTTNNLKDVNFVGADLTQTQIGSAVNLSGAKFSKETKLPMSESAALQRGMIKVNFTDVDVALGIAAVSGNMTELERLLNEKDANPNADTLASYPLNSSISNRNMEMTKTLIAFGAKIQSPNINALTTAIASGNEAMSHYLLSKGASPNFKSKSEMLPTFLVAAARSSVTLLSAMVRAGADVNGQAAGSCDTALASALTNNSLNSVSFLLEIGATASPKMDEKTTCVFEQLPLYLAATRNFPDWKGTQSLIETLLTKGANPDQRIGDESVYSKLLNFLLPASADKFAYVTELFLSKGKINPAYKDATGRNYARIILDRFTDASVIDPTIEKILVRFAEVGVAPDVPDTNGKTFLSKYFEKEPRYWDIDIVRSVLKMKPNLNLTDATGNTMVHKMASQFDSYYTGTHLSELLKAGANPNLFNNNGASPLALCKRGDCVTTLLTGGANPNLQNSSGKTAAMFQIEAGSLLTELLALSTTDLKLKDAAGLNIIDYALKSSNAKSLVMSLSKYTKDHGIFTAKSAVCSTAEQEIAVNFDGMNILESDYPRYANFSVLNKKDGSVYRSIGGFPTRQVGFTNGKVVIELASAVNQSTGPVTSISVRTSNFQGGEVVVNGGAVTAPCTLSSTPVAALTDARFECSQSGYTMYAVVTTEGELKGDYVSYNNYNGTFAWLPSLPSDLLKDFVAMTVTPRSTSASPTYMLLPKSFKSTATGATVESRTYSKIPVSAADTNYVSGTCRKVN